MVGRSEGLESESQFDFDRGTIDLIPLFRDDILGSGLPFDTEADSDARRAITKYRIVDTAIKLFAERGFDACGMRDIAAATGIKAPAIYNHYDSKDRVLAAAMEHILARFFAALLDPLGELQIDDWLEAIVRGHITFQLTHRDLSLANDVLLNSPGQERALPPVVYRRIRKVERDYIRLLRALIMHGEPGIDPDEALVASFAIVAMGDRVVGWHAPSGSLNTSDIADISWGLVFRMIHCDQSA